MRVNRAAPAGRDPAGERARAVADERLVEELRDAIDAVAERRTPDLIDEARAEAEVRVRARLAAAFEAALLDRASRELGTSDAGPRTAEPRRSSADPSESERVETAAQPDLAASPPPGQPSDELGFYVYGVARAQETDIPDELEGV